MIAGSGLVRDALRAMPLEALPPALQRRRRRRLRRRDGSHRTLRQPQVPSPASALVCCASSRYQSDQVDKAEGPPVRNRNRPLRAALLGVADNLILRNHHFRRLATQWARQGKNPRDIRVRVGLRFCRIAFRMVAGRQAFRHPCIQGRHYILDKLTAFHRDHDTGMAEVPRDLQAACGQLPPREHAAEARPLRDEPQRIHDGRRRGPQLLGEARTVFVFCFGIICSMAGLAPGVRGCPAARRNTVPGGRPRSTPPRAPGGSPPRPPTDSGTCPDP